MTNKQANELNAKLVKELNMLNTAFVAGDIFLFVGEIIKRKIPRLSRELTEIVIRYTCNDVPRSNTSYWRSVANVVSDRLGVEITSRQAKYYGRDKHRSNEYRQKI